MGERERLGWFSSRARDKTFGVAILGNSVCIYETKLERENASCTACGMLTCIPQLVPPVMRSSSPSSPTTTAFSSSSLRT